MDELPKEERRLILRVRERWQRACLDRPFPHPREIDPAAFGDDWPHCYLLDLADRDDPAFAYVGGAFEFAGRRFSDCPIGSLLRSAAGAFPQALASRAPVVFMGSGLDDDRPILLRAILLPLSRNGTDVDTLLGAANCRFLTTDRRAAA